MKEQFVNHRRDEGIVISLPILALMDAARSGETVTVRFRAGRQNRPGYSVTGRVEAFVKRPGEAEKVRLIEPGSGEYCRTEIAVGKVYAVEARGQKEATA